MLYQYATNDDKKFVTVSIFYNPGNDYGARRGYRASFSVGTIEDDGCRVYYPQQGFNVFLLEVQRKSKKAENEARDILSGCLPRYLDKLNEKNGFRVVPGSKRIIEA